MQHFFAFAATFPFHLTSAGLYGNIVNSGGTTILDVSAGEVSQINAAQTYINILNTIPL